MPVYPDKYYTLIFKIVYFFIWLTLGPSIVTKMSQIVYNSSNLVGNGSNYLLNKSPELKASGNSNSIMMMNSSAFFSATIDDQTRFKDNYQLAIKRYINREFEICFDIVSGLVGELLDAKDKSETGSKVLKISDDLTTSICKLYLSVSDLILKETRGLKRVSKNNSNNYNNGEAENEHEEYQAFHQDFLKGLFYDQILKIFDNQYLLIDPELFLLCFMIELANEMPTDLIIEQMDTCLNEVGVLPNGYEAFEIADNTSNEPKSQQSKLEKIFDFYTIHVLVRANAIEKSKRIIGAMFINNEGKLHQYLSNLNNAIDSQKLKERGRNHQAERQTLPQKTQQQESRSLNTSQQNKFSTSVSNGGFETDKRKKPIKKKKSEKRLAHASSSDQWLLETFKKYVFGDELTGIVKLVRPGVLLILLLSIILSFRKVASRGYLIRLRAILMYLLFKFKDTLAMAFKITYI